MDNFNGGGKMKKVISLGIIFIYLFSLSVNAQTENEIVTPDQPSYFTKVKMPEYFQLLFTSNKIGKRLEFMEKRRLEYEKLSAKFNETSKRKQSKLLEHLNNLEANRLEHQRFIENNFKTLNKQNRLHVFDQLQKHQERLLEVQQKLPEPAQQRITTAIASSGKVIQKFNSSVDSIRTFEKLKLLKKA